MNLLPNAWSFDAFVQGWKGSGFISYNTYFLNTFKMIIPCVVFGALSSVVVAYGFARFNFTGRKFCFMVMICTMLLPGTTMIIPRYVMFNKLGWIDTYLPFWVPMALATVTFNNYMLIVFFQGLPRELDEAAYIDGAGSWVILWRIYVPISQAAIVTIIVFIFVASWNNFFEPLLFINTTAKYVLSLALRMTFDQSEVTWNKALAMSFLAVLPVIIIFLSGQKYFVEGVAAAGLKE